MIIEDKNIYIRYLPEGMPLYFQPWFLEAVDSEWTAFAFMENDKPTWIWAGVIKRKYGIKKYVSPMFTHALSPIILNDNYDPKTFEKIFSIGRLMVVDRYNYFDEDNFLRWNKQRRYRQLIDLASYPSDLKDIKKSKRNKINKVRNGHISKHDNIKEFHLLHEGSFKRRGKEEIALEKVTQIYEKLKSAPGESYVYILKDNQGNVLAGQWLYGYRDTLYGINRGKNYSINQRGAQEYVMWNVCQELREKYRFYDLGGSSIPGVRSFNMDMGGEDLSYVVYTKIKLFV